MNNNMKCQKHQLEKLSIVKAITTLQMPPAWTWHSSNPFHKGHTRQLCVKNVTH
jgi:hypothetical protein